MTDISIVGPLVDIPEDKEVWMNEEGRWVNRRTTPTGTSTSPGGQRAANARSPQASGKVVQFLSKILKGNE